MLRDIPIACRYLPVLQLVTLLMTPATAIYAIGGLLASPVVIPAIIIKNLVVLVRVAHNPWLGVTAWHAAQPTCRALYLDCQVLFGNACEDATQLGVV